jgi:hypothetical protein
MVLTGTNARMLRPIGKPNTVLDGKSFLSNENDMVLNYIPWKIN